jgi:hypothetical protein
MHVLSSYVAPVTYYYIILPLYSESSKLHTSSRFYNTYIYFLTVKEEADCKFPELILQEQLSHDC